MVGNIETLLLLLGMIGVLAVVAERLRFPFPILLVIAGLGIGLSPGLPEMGLDPQLVLMIFLPPLLYTAAWNFPWEDFRAHLLPIFVLAVGLVFATIVCVAYAAHWLIPGMTLATGYVLGAIISPPDAVAATAVLKKLRMPRRLSTVLEGESLVNDSSGLVAYQFAVAAVVTGSFSLRAASLDFVWMSLGGILFGWLVALMVGRVHRRLSDPAVQVTLSLLTPYMIYLPAEKFGISGVLAVVTAGLQLGHHSWFSLGAASRLHRNVIWSFVEYLLNGLVFILIGLQFPAILRGIEGMPIVNIVFGGIVICLVVIGVRFLWIFPLAWVEHHFLRRGEDPRNFLSKAALVVLSWAGMRGVVSLAAALALPLTTSAGEDFPFRHLILFLTFCVIFVTLVLQGLSLPWLVKKLGVEDRSPSYEDEAHARIEVLGEILSEIDHLEAAVQGHRQKESLAMWRGHFQGRLENLKTRLALLPETTHSSVEWERETFTHIMERGRRSLTEMKRSGKISEDVRRRIEYDLDLEQNRIQRVFMRPD